MFILNLCGKGVAAKLLAGLEEFLERSPGGPVIVGSALGVVGSALGMTGCGERMAAKLLTCLEEVLEGVPGRHLNRSILGGHLLLVKGGCVGGVNDDCVGREHYDCYLFGMFHQKIFVFMFNSSPGSNDNSFFSPGSNDNHILTF